MTAAWLLLTALAVLGAVQVARWACALGARVRARIERWDP